MTFILATDRTILLCVYLNTSNLEKLTHAKFLYLLQKMKYGDHIIIVFGDHKS